jgi:hypothetical protein
MSLIFKRFCKLLIYNENRMSLIFKENRMSLIFKEMLHSLLERLKRLITRSNYSETIIAKRI